MTSVTSASADLFREAIAALQGARVRDELHLTEIAAPTSLAPHAFALAADVRPVNHAEDSEWGTGRIVVLFDEECPEEWGGPWRIVCFAQGPLEPEIGVEQYVADVAWSWLMDALDSHAADFHSESGTATKILSRGYGSLAEQGEGAQLELRASWSPGSDNLVPHIEAWAELLALLAGMPPGTERVSVLDAHRRRS
ncbi:MAG TPA: DUF3000 family protein [Microbacteriaceae bacterium]|nr:DUF3000 family protein [Microbacteriaceae bacterium]